MVHYVLIRVPEKCLLAGEGDKKIYEEIMAEKLPNLIKKKKKNPKNYKLTNLRTLSNPRYHKHTYTHTAEHIKIELLKDSDKKKNLKISQRKKAHDVQGNKEKNESCCCCCCIASVVSDSVRPQRWQPIRLPRPWDSPGKNTGVGCHFLFQCMKVKSLSHVRLLVTPWTAAYQAPPSMGFSRQEY